MHHRQQPATSTGELKTTPSIPKQGKGVQHNPTISFNELPTWSFGLSCAFFGVLLRALFRSTSFNSYSIWLHLDEHHRRRCQQKPGSISNHLPVITRSSRSQVSDLYREGETKMIAFAKTSKDLPHRRNTNERQQNLPKGDTNSRSHVMRSPTNSRSRRVSASRTPRTMLPCWGSPKPDREGRCCRGGSEQGNSRHWGHATTGVHGAVPQ